MDCRGGVNAIFKRAALLALTAVMGVAFGSSAAVAGPRRTSSAASSWTCPVWTPCCTR